MKRKKEGIYQKNQFITRKKNADLIRSVKQAHPCKGTTSQQDQQRENNKLRDQKRHPQNSVKNYLVTEELWAKTKFSLKNITREGPMRSNG